MRVVLLLLHLLACDVQVVAAECDYIVAAVGRRMVRGLVLAHQGESDARCDSAEGRGVAADVDDVPGAGVGEAGLIDVGLV